jgi:ribosomal protein S6
MKCDELKPLMCAHEPNVRPMYDKHEVDAAIAELKQKLEDAKASHYAEMVDAGMRERRLKRAFYKACANWAHHRVFVRFNSNEKAWENVERKCRAKAEEYK